MKKIKLFFSIFTFTLLSAFVFPLFLGIVSLQQLSFFPSPFGFFNFNRLIVKEWEKQKKPSLEKERKRIARIAKEESETLAAFGALSHEYHKQKNWKKSLSYRYWLSPIVIGLKEITDKNGKTYKLDKIVPALKRTNSPASGCRSSCIKDFFDSNLDFTLIKGEGRQQLLSLLEKGTGEPLGIITEEKIIEYQEIFLNLIRPYLTESHKIFISKFKTNSFPKNVGYGGSQQNEPWLLNADSVRLNFISLFRNENLETVLYKELDEISRELLIEIPIYIKSLSGVVGVFRKAVDAFRNWNYRFSKSHALKPLRNNSENSLPKEVVLLVDEAKEKPDTALIKKSKKIQVAKKQIKVVKTQPETALIEIFAQEVQTEKKQIKVVKTQPEIALIEILKTQKVPTVKKQTKMIKIQPEIVSTKILKNKKAKAIKEVSLQTRWEKTKLIIALSATGGALTFSALSGCLYWFLKNKKITFSLPCLQNQE